LSGSPKGFKLIGPDKLLPKPRPLGKGRGRREKWKD